MPGMLKRFGSAGKDLLEEFYKKSPTQRLADASERATWDPADGGLGLAPGNTSYERMQLMFPTQVYHGGKGNAARFEQPMGDMFLSNHPGVAGTYAKGMQREPVPSDDPWIREQLLKVPDYNGNVMPLRLNQEGAAVVDYGGRLFSGHTSEWSDIDAGILNDAMVTDANKTPLIRIRREYDENGLYKKNAYLPTETPFWSASDHPISTNDLHSMSGAAINKQYGYEPSMTRFDNIVDLGYGFRYRGEPNSMFKPQTVWSVRDGSKIRSEYGAFDPLLRKYSGLSLGTSAAAVGSLLDQLPADEDKGALYQ